MPPTRIDRSSSSPMVVKNDIFPIFVIDVDHGGSILSFEGTGFLILPRVLVTCWHCVRRPLPSNQRYAVAALHTDTYYHLADIDQHPGNMDLATARIDELQPTLGLSLARDSDVGAGLDVLTYGYPLGLVTREPDRDILDISGRALRGYVTRIFRHSLVEYEPTPALELDMLVPAGLSGAPLLAYGTRTVVGVIYGAMSVDQIEELATIDSRTGERLPEVRRVIAFGAAHQASSLRSLSGRATGGLAIEELLKVE